MFKVYNSFENAVESESATAIMDEIKRAVWVYVDGTGIVWKHYKAALFEAARIDLFSMSHLAPMSIPHIVTDFLIIGDIIDEHQLGIAIESLKSDDFSRMVQALYYSYATNDPYPCLSIFEYKYNLTKQDTGFDLHLKAMCYFTIYDCYYASLKALKPIRHAIDGDPIQPYWLRLMACRHKDHFKLKEILV